MTKRLGLLVLIFAMGSQAFAAGFEKTVLWGGREAGIAGAGAADSSGPSALFFNPAGLAASTGTQVSINFSPTFAKLEGAFTNNLVSESSNRFIPIFGVLASHKITDKLGIGIGSYISGGGQVEFNNIAIPSSFTGTGSFAPSARSQFAIMEHSVGVGYEVIPGLRIGANWRVVQVSARLTTPVFVDQGNPAVGAESIAEYDQNLSATRWNGWRLGASYEGTRWGAGASVRTAIDFTARGDATLRFWNSAAPGFTTPVTLTNSDTSAANRLPLQAQLGGYYDVLENQLRAHLEYSWTDYTENDSVIRSGAFSGLPAGTLTNTFGAMANVSQQWLPLSIWRVGFEYSGLTDMTLRAGYALAGQVTPDSLARATFSPPGKGHTVTLGAGTEIMEKKIELNGAIEYAWASGAVESSETAGPPLGSAIGDYKARAYALHVGATYRF